MLKRTLHKTTNLLLGIFLLIPYLSATQTIDSLKAELGKSHNVNKKLEVLSLLSVDYFNVLPDSSIYYARQGVQLSKKSGNTEYLGILLSGVGDVLVVRDSLEKAAQTYKRALDLFIESDDVKNQAGILTVLGNISIVKGNSPEAMDYYIRALSLSEEHSIKERIPYLYMNIGTAQMIGDNIEQAQEYYLKSLNRFLLINDSLNIARNYANLGLTYFELDELELAFEYLDKSLAIFISIHAYADIADNYLNLSLISIQRENYDKAIEHLLTSLDYIDRIDVSYKGPRIDKKINVKYHLGNVYLKAGALDSSYKYLSEAFSLSKKRNWIKIVGSSSENLSLLFEMKGQFDSALYYFKEHKIASDSLSNKDNIKKLASLNAQLIYNEQLKEEQIKRVEIQEEQKRKTTFLTATIVTLVLVLILLLLLLQLRRSRIKSYELKQKNLQNELELKNKELTTHVLYQLKKNEFILSISKKLRAAVSRLKPENKKVIEDVIHDLDMDSGDDVWKDFEIRFQQVHQDFYKNLAKDYPDISSNELRLCGFLKLNMNSKDISAITYQTVNSIDVARSRLRQKFDLSKEESLTAFLSQY